MPLQQNTNSILFIQSLNVFQYSRNPKYQDRDKFLGNIKMYGRDFNSFQECLS